MNISISDKTLSNIKIGDIVLAYEPKNHKISKDENGKDGYCCICPKSRNDGRQAFIAAFKIVNKPFVIKSMVEYGTSNYVDNWHYDETKKTKKDDDKKLFLQKYFTYVVIYVFPIQHIKVKEIKANQYNLIMMLLSRILLTN
jgi:hypothetical protein